MAVIALKCVVVIYTTFAWSRSCSHLERVRIELTNAKEVAYMCM